MIETTYSEHVLCSDNKYQHWDPIPAAVLALNMYIVHNLNNFDAYALCNMHDRNLVVVRHKRTNSTHAIACVLYSMYCDKYRVLYVHCLCATHDYLAKFLERLYSYTCANVKLKLSCTIAIYSYTHASSSTWTTHDIYTHSQL